MPFYWIIKIKYIFTLLIIILTFIDPNINTVSQTLVPYSQQQIQLSFAKLVEQTSPSVVNIYATRRTHQNPNSFHNNLLEYFLGDLSFYNRQRVENSLGSGVIVDTKGLVISNLHVLEGAEDIRVITHDRREYPAKIILTDAKTDLVIIRLLGLKSPLKALDFADVYSAKVGDLVLAIGNPFGVSQTVTSGIISGLSRSQVNKDRYQSFIQTDAAINPGNSGGALINTNGQLLGINSTIISPSGVSSGLGFAIPVNMLEPLLYAARKNVPLNRVWLGFDPRPVDNDTAEALGLDYPHGVLVGDIYPGSPGAIAGLQVGDHIIAVENVPIDTPDTLLFYMATLIPENTPEVVFTLYNQKAIKLPVSFPPAIPAPKPYLFQDASILDGSNVINLSPFVAENMGIPLQLKGVIINHLQPLSVASRLGFKVGDVILKINDVNIDDVDQLKNTLKDLFGQKNFYICIWRNGRVINWQIY